MARPPDPADETLVDSDWTPGPQTEVVYEEREAPPPPPRRRLPTLWPWLLALLVLALAGIGAALYFSQDDDEGTTATTTQAAARVEVPLLVGLREQRALEVLRDAGLQPGETSRRAGTKPAGVVTEQEPEAGARVAEGMDVALVVSQGPPRETVPDLVGERVDQAVGDLEQAGFESSVGRVFAEEPAGVVVEQAPQAGTKLKEGATVALQVSKGPEPVPVPDLVGRQVSEATGAVRDAGFRVNIVTVPSQEPGGTVVAQNPVGGTLAKPGTAIRLNVAQTTTSEGTTTQGTTTGQTTPAQPAGPATVPDVVGLTQAEAAKALHDAGLKPSLQYVPSQDVPEGLVVAQARPAGTTLERGDAVGVNVSVGPDQVPLVTVPNVEGEREQAARTRLQEAGFRVQVLKEVTDDAGRGRCRHRPAAGQKRTRRRARHDLRRPLLDARRGRARAPGRDGRAPSPARRSARRARR